MKDIFESTAQVLVNPVNCLGIMGAGLAKQFRARYPQPSQEYMFECHETGMNPGQILPVKDPSGKWVVHFATKNDWRKPSRLNWIEAGLFDLSEWAHGQNIQSIAVPALGAGLGDLPWEPVKALIEKHLGWLGEGLEVYEPRNYK